MDNNGRANWNETDLGKWVSKEIRSNVAAGVESYRAELGERFTNINTDFLTIDEALKRLVESTVLFDNRTKAGSISMGQMISGIEEFIGGVRDMATLVRDDLPVLFYDEVQSARQKMTERARSRGRVLVSRDMSSDLRR